MFLNFSAQLTYSILLLSQMFEVQNIFFLRNDENMVVGLKLFKVD